MAFFLECSSWLYNKNVTIVERCSVWQAGDPRPDIIPKVKLYIAETRSNKASHLLIHPPLQFRTRYSRDDIGKGGRGEFALPWFWKIVIFCVFAHNIFFSSYFAPLPPRKSVKILTPPWKKLIWRPWGIGLSITSKTA